MNAGYQDTENWRWRKLGKKIKNWMFNTLRMSLEYSILEVLRGIRLSNINLEAIHAGMAFEAMKVEENTVRKCKVRHEVDPRSIPD